MENPSHIKKTILIALSFLILLFIFVFFTTSYGFSKSEEPEEVFFVQEEIEPLENYKPVYTEYKSEESEEYLWNKLNEFSPSDYVTAGTLGYFKRESELRSDAVSGWHTALAVYGEDHCVIFTEAIDAGLSDGSTYEQFMHDCKYKYGGYGLGQWSSTEYCNDLYLLAHEQGKSIGDADLQCEFVMMSMAKNEFLWNQLMEVKSATRAGELIALLYDGSQNAMGYSATMAQYYYDKYVEER